ncbi:dethiobiotin synthase [Paenibacillus apiarius]|uniref:ATP-dependent dethiobiotin synthetase BioD n=1 Tax=Paenibacillus apiarius TaxID=46240 RepID=A0ABT4E0Q8_9BACL|nr:dethiobiotin synthase [Paenibacillus apiarius]MCY9516791.1 dethiobiotin synthase [Paenibacillus apiarius]MCY9523166.1 dethiobiotin synthase [Paenibacillus apiarius]MCY9555473.1 dethiobiotin synthase [Paenibacillus apiarius]MCY9559657.1 dethiobiotin synthase [Paenibacillus apiarius]MCY9686499.1 dethiobiotin synthase [Paenibacillus apiarius]
MSTQMRRASGTHKGLFVSSTGTGVGKTVVTAGIAAYFHQIRKRKLQLWKPVQSGTTIGDPEADTYRLRMGSGMTGISEDKMATWTLPDPLAPWMAFERAGVAFSFPALLEEGQRRLKEQSLLLIEGAGGIAVPFTQRDTMADLAYGLQVPLLLVSSSGLGTVSHTVTAVHYARARGITDVAVALSGPKVMAEAREAEENARMIEAMADVPVLGLVPWLPQPDRARASESSAWAIWREQWLASFTKMNRFTQWLLERE